VAELVRSSFRQQNRLKFGGMAEKFHCMLCDQEEARCKCERYCCLCQAQHDIRLCQDGAYYCQVCREACDLQAQYG
jgi:hypothetical protein